MKTIPELEAEAAVAAEALANAKRAAAEASEADKAAAAKKAAEEAHAAALIAPPPADITAKWGHLTQIMVALGALIAADPDLVSIAEVSVAPAERNVFEGDSGPTVSWTHPHLVARLRGEAVYTRIEFKDERTGGSWHSRPTGKLRLTVGDYGSTTSYPQKKDGTFNYAGAAAVLFPEFRRAEQKHQAALCVQSNAEAVATLRAKFGLPEHSEVIRTSAWHRDFNGRSGHEVTAPAGSVLLKISRTVTHAQAEAILAAAIAAGVKL